MTMHIAVQNGISWNYDTNYDDMMRYVSAAVLKTVQESDF